jgi:hypothetical protein
MPLHDSPHFIVVYRLTAMLTFELGFDAAAVDRVIARHHTSGEVSTQSPHESLAFALVVALIGQ